jgi:hypothetical protein
VSVSNGKSKIEVGQWVFIGPGKSALKAQVIDDRGVIGYDKEPAFLLLVPGEEGLEGRTTVVVESRLIPA